MRIGSVKEAMNKIIFICIYDLKKIGFKNVDKVTIFTTYNRITATKLLKMYNLLSKYPFNKDNNETMLFYRTALMIILTNIKKLNQ